MSTFIGDYIAQGKSNNFLKAEEEGKMTLGEAAKLINRKLKADLKAIDKKVMAIDLEGFSTEWHHAGVFKKYNGKLGGKKVYFLTKEQAESITLEQLANVWDKKSQEQEEGKKEVKGYFIRLEVSYGGAYGKKTWIPTMYAYSGTENGTPQKFCRLDEKDYLIAKAFNGLTLKPYTDPNFEELRAIYKEAENKFQDELKSLRKKSAEKCLLEHGCTASKIGGKTNIQGIYIDLETKKISGNSFFVDKIELYEGACKDKPKNKEFFHITPLEAQYLNSNKQWITGSLRLDSLDFSKNIEKEKNVQAEYARKLAEKENNRLKMFESVKNTPAGLEKINAVKQAYRNGTLDEFIKEGKHKSLHWEVFRIAKEEAIAEEKFATETIIRKKMIADVQQIQYFDENKAEIIDAEHFSEQLEDARSQRVHFINEDFERLYLEIPLACHLEVGYKVELKLYKGAFEDLTVLERKSVFQMDTDEANKKINLYTATDKEIQNAKNNSITL
jgi:hypothetical protein